MRVLISAYACEPEAGSEPGLGWNMVQEIAREHQVWVLTSNTHRTPIKEEILQRPVSGLQFIYLDPIGWTYDWSNEGNRVHWNIHLHYYLWQIQAYFVGKDLHQRIGFDLVHHVTYARYATPSFLSLLPIPFVWGPLGGGEFAPEAFFQSFTFRGQAYEYLRAIAAQFGELDPFVKLTARRSTFAFASTEDTAKRLRKIGARQIVVLPSIALAEEEIHHLVENASQSIPKTIFISVGRLLHWKGFHLGLQAFAKATLPDDAEYWIIGEGAERERLAELAENLGIDHQVKFLSQLPRSKVLKLLSSGLALVHPSLHESGGFVCLEAMAAGRPVICLDIGGPAMQVTEETGFKISSQTPDQVIQDIAQAMTRVTSDPELWKKMSEAGQRHVTESCTWRSKGEVIEQYYQKIFNLNQTPI